MGGKSTLSKVPVWAYASAVMAALGYYVYLQASANGQGVIAYALDDAYIHLAVAKNLAFHGVWGPTPYEAASASSSPGWILILATLMRIVGNRAWLPLALNALAAFGLTYAVERLLRPYSRNLVMRTFDTVLILILLPLPTYVAMGMEHTLQMLFVACFFGFARKVFATEHRFNSKGAWALFGMVAGMILVRIDCTVLLPIPILFALYKKDFRAAAGLVAGPICAIAIMAIIARWQGFALEPNSVAVKRVTLAHAGGDLLTFYWNTAVGHFAGVPAVEWLWNGLAVIFTGLLVTGKGHTALRAALAVCAILFLFVGDYAWLWLGLAAVLALVLTMAEPSAAKLLLYTSLLGFILHAMNGQFHWFYRYEGYLLVFSLLTAFAAFFEMGPCLTRRPDGTLSLAKPFPWRPIWVLAGLAVALGVHTSPGLDSHLTERAMKAMDDTTMAPANIGHQQMQMAFFIERFYPGSSILINDIGAICYYSDPHLLDDAGLGTTEVTKARIDGTFNMDVLKQMMRRRGVRIGIIYPLAPQWLPGPLRMDDPDIIPVASWFIPNNVVAASGGVLFVATSRKDAETLRANLKAFQPELPKDVQVRYVASND